MTILIIIVTIFVLPIFLYREAVKEEQHERLMRIDPEYRRAYQRKLKSKRRYTKKEAGYIAHRSFSH